MNQQDHVSAEWVFGYGSLMWSPGFTYEIQCKAELIGYRRAMCVFSWKSRGTKENPGLVLGLVPEPSSICQGVAFRVPKDSIQDVLDYLMERENTPSECYTPEYVIVHLKGEHGVDCAKVIALCFVSKQDHIQYAGHLTLEQQIQIISKSSGIHGTSLDYLTKTVAALQSLEIEDSSLDLLLKFVNNIRRE